MENKHLKIAIVGYGSIGKRHERNLRTLGFGDVVVFDIGNRLTSKILGGFDVALICSPNNLHVKHATMAASAGCHLFIEKPLSHNFKGIAELRKIIKQNKLVNMVACNMRFHPALAFVKKYLRAGSLGKVYSIFHEFGHFLPYWRKTDYRKNYAAKRSSGGGIILDDVHEFDLLFWLNDFAAVAEAKIISGQLSRLAIETEDFAIGTFRFKNGVIGAVKCDYLNQAYTRRCQIVGEKGTLSWDFAENVVWRSNKKGRRALRRIRKYDSNVMYVREMKYFLDCVARRRKTFNDIGRAAEILKHLV